MTEPLVSLPAFVSQLNMSLLLDAQGLHELVPQQDGLYAKNKLLATYQDSTWTMVPGVISGSELVGDNETARLGTFHLPFRINKTVAIKDSFVPKSRELLIHLRSGCLSRSGMLEMIRHDAVRNHGCTKEGAEGIGIGTSSVCYGCAATQNKFPGNNRKRGRENLSSDYRKSGRAPHQNTGARLGRDIATDTFGPLPEDHKGHRYGQVFVDIQTRVAWIYLMTAKSDFYSVLRQFLLDYAIKYPKHGVPQIHRTDKMLTFEGTQGKIQTMRSDNAPELTSKQVKRLMEEHRIVQLHSVPHDHKMNGYAERFIRTATTIAEACMANARFDDEDRKMIYCRAMKHAADIYNLLRPHRGLGFKTPYEAWTGRKPNANWLRVFGATTYVYLEKHERPSGKRSRPFEVGIYVGIDPGAIGTKPTHNVYVPAWDKVVNRRSLVFNETMSHDEDRWSRLENGETFIEMMDHLKVIEDTETFKTVYAEQIARDLLEPERPEDREEVKANVALIFNDERPNSNATSAVMMNETMTYTQQGKSNIDMTIKPAVDEGSNFYHDMAQEKRCQIKKASATCNQIKHKVPIEEFDKHKEAWLRKAKARKLQKYNCTNHRIRKARAKSSQNRRNGDIKLTSASDDELTVSIREAWVRRVIKKRHKQGQTLKTGLSDDIKMSDWDNPSLQWARSREDWPQWLAAIKKEIDQLEARGTWKIVQESDVKKGCRPLGTKLVLKIKRQPDGSVDKYKARLTVQGFMQRYGIDYLDTSSPVTLTSSVKFLKAHALQMGRKTKVFDFAGAFLYPHLRDDIYMHAPELLGKGKVILKLLKSLYGLKQASREWYLALKGALLSIGFIQAPIDVDECLFYHERLDIYISAYVDDSFCSYVSEENLEWVINELKKKDFEFSKIDELNQGLGMEFETSENEVFISQPNYVDFLHDEFDVPDHVKSTPIVQWYERRREEETKFDKEQTTKYLSLLGSLSHLARMTRPDIVLAVFHLATFCADACERHYQGLIHIVQYLLGTKTRGVRFRKSPENELWEFYCDSDWAGCPTTRKSTSGYLVKFMGGPLVAVSRRQKTVALSSCEAEYCTFVDCAKDIIWARGIAEFFKCPFPTPATLRCDNLTAKHMAEGTAQLKRMKHVDGLRKFTQVKYHWIRDLVQHGVVELTYVDTTLNESDILTKPLARTKFKEGRDKLLNDGHVAYRTEASQDGILKVTLDAEIAEKMLSVRIVPLGHSRQRKIDTGCIAQIARCVQQH